MKSGKLLIFLAMLALLLGLLAASAYAAPPGPDTDPAEVFQASLDASGATQSGIENVGTSTLANVTPGYLPIGTPFDLCFSVFVQSPDAEYMDHFDVDLPDGWTVNSVAANSVPPANGCSGALPPVVGVNAGNLVYWQSTGYPPQTGCGAWNGSSAGANFDFCANVTIPDTSGAPWMLPWNYIGDGYGGTPHQVSGSYGPIGPPLPIMLMPEEILAEGCAYEPQTHSFTVLNNAGYDATVNLTYSILAGAGTCTGPASVVVPNSGSLPFDVILTPVGVPSDTVVCQIIAVDAANPNNTDTSLIVKHLAAWFWDPAGWQIEPIAAATPNQWAGGVVGTNPAAAGPVGYVVGGLAAGSSVINPDLQMYDPGTGVWTQLADLPNPRFSPVVGWIGGLLYAAGGYDTAFAATNDLQVYDPVAGTWDNATPADIPNLRGGGAGGVGVCASGSGPCLFHVGGGPDSNFASTTLETWQYDPGANAWTQLDNKPAGSSPDGHILGAGVGCLGHIYVGGDYRGYDEFYRLDATQPAGSQWTQLANIPATAGAMTPALVCKEEVGVIVLIGGDPYGGWSAYNNTVYVYDIATDTWSGPLPQTLNVAQLGSVGWHMYGRVWTAGGTVGSGAISPMPHESLAQIMCEQQPIIWDKYIDGEPWAPDMVITRETSNTIEVVEVLHLTPSMPPPPPLAGSKPAALVPPGGGWLPGEAADVVGAAVPQGPAPASLPGAPWEMPEVVLYDNGPLVTHPGGGAGGADASAVQTALAMTLYGSNVSLSGGYRIADGFTISDAGGWQIDQITFFAYQTNSGNSCTLDHVNYQIWNGPPNDPGSSVVYGDTTTNRMASCAWSNIYRVLDTDLTNTQRPIMAMVASAGVTLPPGTYWLDWQIGGTLTSGPWQPPITILGQTTTGDALQWVAANGAWQAMVDGTNAQGVPFILEGPDVQLPVFTQIEDWDPTKLRLLDWAATGGEVIVEPDRVVWTGQILEPMTITLTKWFHVEPCTWTETLLWEELWLDQTELEQRPVLINHLLPELWIGATGGGPVFAGDLASFTLIFTNTGGFENMAMIRNEFPETAPFESSVPPPSRVDPAGLWVEWDLLDLPTGYQNSIDVTVMISSTLPPSTTIEIWDGIFDHTGVLRDWVIIMFHVEPPPYHYVYLPLILRNYTP